MQPAIIQAWEIGCFHIIFSIPDQWLTIVCWLMLPAGCGIQLLLDRSHRRWVRCSLITALLLCLLLLEVCCQIITGWDLILYIVSYFLCLLLLIGALLALPIRRLLHKQ